MESHGIACARCSVVSEKLPGNWQPALVTDPCSALMSVDCILSVSLRSSKFEKKSFQKLLSEVASLALPSGQTGETRRTEKCAAGLNGAFDLDRDCLQQHHLVS